MKMKASSVLLSVAVVLGSFNQAWASDASGQAFGQAFGKAQQDKIISKLADALENRYVLEKQGKKFASELRDVHNTGTWTEINDKDAFVEAVNTRLYEITRDKHVALSAARGDGKARPQRKMVRVKPGEQSGKSMKKRMGLPAGDSVTSKILPGNIGLLTIDNLMGTVSGMHEAMAKLQDTDGLIIDVRQCPGGKGQIAYNLASYFMDEGKLLTRYLTRGEAPREQLSVTLPDGNKRYQNKPVHVVTSNFTGSACEALTYVLKYHNLATVVGENTAGAGHGSNNGLVKVGFGLTAFVPNTRPEHPNHVGGFEKIGVPVDVASNSEFAIDKAQQLILTQLINDSAKQGENQEQLTQLLLASSQKLNESLLQQAQNRQRYQSVIGEYGKVALLFDQGQLKYRSVSGRLVPLKAVGEDEFASTFKRAPIKVRIERDQNGDVTGIRLPPKPGKKDWTVFARL